MWFRRSAWKVKQKYNRPTCIQVKFGSSSTANSHSPMFVYFFCVVCLLVRTYKTRSAPFTFFIKRCCAMLLLVNNSIKFMSNRRIKLKRHQHYAVAKPGFLAPLCEKKIAPLTTTATIMMMTTSISQKQS